MGNEWDEMVLPSSDVLVVWLALALCPCAYASGRLALRKLGWCALACVGWYDMVNCPDCARRGATQCYAVLCGIDGPRVSAGESHERVGARVAQCAMRRWMRWCKACRRWRTDSLDPERRDGWWAREGGGRWGRSRRLCGACSSSQESSRLGAESWIGSPQFLIADLLSFALFPLFEGLY